MTQLDMFEGRAPCGPLFVPAPSPAPAQPEFTKQVEIDSEPARDMLAQCNAVRDRMIGSPELKEVFRKLGRKEHNQPPSHAMRWHLAEQEQAIAQDEADAEAKQLFECDSCGHEFMIEARTIHDDGKARCNWCTNYHTAEKVDPALFAQMEDTYCADMIGMHGRTRKTCQWMGMEMVCTGTRGRAGEVNVSMYSLQANDGTAKPYGEHNLHGPMRDEFGSYHGMAVKSRGRDMMLVGPELHFREGEAAQSALL